tara:strand:+ start:6886 stop:7782 length:897 start_codon:yes stop_codon:yes gene_type:complete
MDISVVIVSYNVEEYIIPCIKSIYKHSKSDYNFEVIVVDNNSKDETIYSLQKHFPDISLIENNYNAGFAVASNQGVKKSIGEFILLLNPDTLFIEDSLKKLLRIARNHDMLGAIGPALINESGGCQQSCWRNPSMTNTILSIFHLDLLNYKKNYKDKKFNDLSNVESVSGAALFIKRKTMDELNGFDERLFWMEDIDLSFRLNQRGYKTYYSPQTKIIHLSGKSAETNYKVSISNKLLSKIKYFKIHHSRFSSIIILFSVVFASLIKATLMFFISPFSTLYRKKMFAYLHTLRFAIKS